MKVLIVNTSDITSGAGRAAYRLHKSLLANGIESTMAVQVNKKHDRTIIASSGFFQKINAVISPFYKNIHLLKYLNRKSDLFSPGLISFSDIQKTIRTIKPNIIHLHWINNGFVKISDIKKIKVPIVWSLHDMWPFTGGCHYSNGCQKYKTGCGCCPILGSTIVQDLSRRIIQKKQKCYNNITFVGLSRWISECAKSSLFAKRNEVVNIPNPIDLQEFFPINKSMCREAYSLSYEKKIILFPSPNSVNDKRKGLSYFIEAVNCLDKNKYQIILIGSKEDYESYKINLPVKYIEPLKDNVSLLLLYNSSDVTVLPSLQENLSNSIMESLACGTPVVAFNVGGNNDMVDHKENGYIAKEESVDDLLCGIKWVIENNSNNKISLSARNKVVRSFEKDKIAQKYVILYNEIFRNKYC